MKVFLFILMLTYGRGVFSKVFVINKDHSSIKFSIKYMIISDVEGRFENFQGSFKYDEKEDLISDVNIKIKTASIDTDNKIRDDHLKKKDFFDVKKHPLIFFKSTSIKKQSPEEFLITGNLTIKGISQESKFLIKKSGRGKDTWGNLNYFFEFYTLISRSDFNLTWNKSLESGKYLVGEEVTISGMIQAQLQGKKTAASKHLIPSNEQTLLRERVQRGEKTLKPDFSALKKKPKIKLPEKVSKAASPKISPKLDKRSLSLPYFIIVFFALIGCVGIIIALKFLVKNRSTDINFSELSPSALAIDIVGMLLLAAFAYAAYELITVI